MRRTTRVCATGGIAASCSLLAWVGSATAAPVTYTFSGAVTDVVQGLAEFDPAIANTTAGDEFELVVNVDTSTVDDNPDPTAGSFYFAPGTFSMMLRIGMHSRSSAAGVEGYGNTGTFTDFGLPVPEDVDWLELGTYQADPGFFTFDQVNVSVEFPASTYSDDGLPTFSPGSPLIGSFIYTSFLNLAGRQPARIFGEITQVTVTPAPAAVGMLIPAGMCVARRRRSKSPR